MIQLFIVHHDAELGRQLVQMVKDYTSYESAFATSESEALVWLRRHASVHPRILLTELEASGFDGFNIAGTLGEMFPGLQTLFFPPYSVAQQRIEIVGSKIFPEPIDGERLIATIERSVRMLPNAPDFFQVIDLLQMCCLAKRSGALQMVADDCVGTIYLRAGAIVQAETALATGQPALDEIVSWREVEFAYDRGLCARAEPLKNRWDELLTKALEENRRRALPEWRQSA